ncbi:MAG: sec-independent protein translocase protein TatC [Solirubrobacteraceae bacterium]|jgi:sec-independent protein translocase protein TatC|nr:sec-independent protein translocase protein TatC [Solirubrobacteraceae bacterium]
MARAIRPIGHEDRLSLIEHLDELRSRIVICTIGFLIAFSVAMWQNHALLDLVNQPLADTTSASIQKASGPLEQTARSQVSLRAALERGAAAFERLSRSRVLTAQDRAALREAVRSYADAARALPRKIPERQPVTLGVTEPLTTTLTVSLYFAVLFTLPLLLYQAYAFILPAFSPQERRIALPLMLLAPFLFLAGVAFCYFIVLPPAVLFLQGFNATSFDVLVQAKPYYSFVIFALISLGLMFQLPIAVIALTRAGIVTVAQLRANRRYAIVVIAVVAMLLPTVDPVSLLLEMVPLLLLYELSILLASWLERTSARRAASAAPATTDDDIPPSSANAV